ncbi:MAG: MucB/RseB C-terminal domain-containing protein [Xanthomonadales bacterium]
MKATAPVVLAAALSLMSALAWAGPEHDHDARHWLERMNAALNQMTYQGTFVYVLGDAIDTLRITHIADADGVREYITSLTGPSREVVRDAEGIRWVQSADRPVLSDSAFEHAYFPAMPQNADALVDGNYALKLGDSGRVAGYDTRRLQVVPRDAYRYGYSLWLEQHSGLLLKWELLDSDRKPLARLMFTDIRFGTEVDPVELKRAERLKEFATEASALPTGRVGASDRPRWQPKRMPPGFELTAHGFHGGGSNGHMFEHLVYSDGLAAVSVYIETRDENVAFEPAVERHGTTHTYSKPVGDVVVTVVGNVPARTVRTIGDSVALVSR